MKPRCSTCDAAMKNPYHRVGAKGKWDSISTWWYCQDCNQMENLPGTIISEDEGTYLHEDAASIYPTIARVRTQHGARNFDLSELLKIVNKRKQWGKYQYRRERPELSGIQKRGIYQDESKIKTTEPGWICQTCYEIVTIEAIELVKMEDSNTLRDNIPTHCVNPMKLGNIGSFQLSTRFDHISKDLQSKLDNSNHPESGKEFLYYFLEMFSSLFIKRMKEEFVLYTNSFPGISELEEYKIIHHLLSILSSKNHYYKFKPITVQEIVTVSLRVNISMEEEIRNRLIKRIIDRFEDIKRKILGLKYVIEGDYFTTISKLWSIQTILESLYSYGWIPDRTSKGKIEDPEKQLMRIKN